MDHSVPRPLFVSHQAMVETGMTKSTIVEAVSKANLELRPGHDKLFRLLETEKVPFLVFSAGLAGKWSLEGVQERQGCLSFCLAARGWWGGGKAPPL